jgi:hypothetical protein
MNFECFVMLSDASAMLLRSGEFPACSLELFVVQLNVNLLLSHQMLTFN